MRSIEIAIAMIASNGELINSIETKLGTSEPSNRNDNNKNLTRIH